jgi:hypothetical protein
MQVSVQCPSCGASQAAEAANTPIIAACAQCGGAITLPAGINARAPERYSYRPAQASPPPPSRTLRNAALIGGIVIAALAGLWLFGPEINFYARYDNPPLAKFEPAHNSNGAPKEPDSEYEWVDYKWSTSDHGQYSAEFPGPAKDNETTTRDDQGELAVHRKVFDTGASHWEVNYVDYPGKPPTLSHLLDKETEILSDYNSGQPVLNRAIDTENFAIARLRVRSGAIESS